MRVALPRIGFIVLGLLALAALSACGSGESDSSPSSTSSASESSSSTTASSTPDGLQAPEKLVSDGQFVACMDVTFPPMEYYEGNSSEPIGFDVAVIKAVAEAWGLSPVYKDTAFEGLLPALSAGRCDVAWSSMYITPERTAAYPAVQYATGRTTVIVPEGNPAGVSSVADLSGKTLVAQTGTSLMEEAEAIAKELKAEGKAPPTIQQYGKATDLIQQLIVGRADAGMTINSEAEFRISRSQGQIEIGFETGSEQKIGIYFPPDDAQLGETLRTALLALEKDGTLEQIAEEEAFPTNAVKVGPIVGLH